MQNNFRRNTTVQKLDQIHNTTIDGYMSIQELYELGVKSGKNTIEELAREYTPEKRQLAEKLIVDNDYSRQMREMKKSLIDKIDCIYEQSRLKREFIENVNYLKEKKENIEKMKNTLEIQLKAYEEGAKNEREKTKKEQ